MVGFSLNSYFDSTDSGRKEVVDHCNNQALYEWYYEGNYWSCNYYADSDKNPNSGALTSTVVAGIRLIVPAENTAIIKPIMKPITALIAPYIKANDKA